MRKLLVPHANMVDADLWIETTQKAAATARLWTVLAISRDEPRLWMPRIVLVGEPGVGRSSLVARFTRAARRSISRDLKARTVGMSSADRDPRDASTQARFEWASEGSRGSACIGRGPANP